MDHESSIWNETKKSTKGGPVGCGRWATARCNRLSGTMGHAWDLISREAMHVTTSIDSGIHWQAMGVTTRDGRSSTGQESIFSCDDSGTSGHSESVWDGISATILGGNTPDNAIITGDERSITGEGLAFNTREGWDSFFGNVSHTTDYKKGGK